MLDESRGACTKALYPPLAALAIASACPAAAQDSSPSADAPGLQDIVVTAERRSSTVQKTPIAITAVGSEALRENNITNISALNSRVPNLTFASNAGDAKIFIRGLGYNSIAPGGETRVAMYLDGIYQSRTQAPLLGFYDIDRLEVLRGPQGTLYGRNAIAGTINIITRDPGTSLNGYLTLGVGNYSALNTEGAIGGPLSSNVEARVAFRTADRQGYGRNISTGEDVNDEHTRSVRGIIKVEPNADVSVKLTADYSRKDDHSGGYRYLGPGNRTVVPLGVTLGVAPADKQDGAGFGPKNDTETFGVTSEIDVALASRTSLTLITGYRFLKSSQKTNDDGTTALLTRHFLDEKSKVFTQEVRLSQGFGDIADLIVGGYYFQEANTASNQAPFLGVTLGLPVPDQLYDFYYSYGKVRTSAYAAFAQASVRPISGVQIDLGARYSHETKKLFEQLQLDFTNPFVAYDQIRPLGEGNQRSTAHSFDPKITISYQPDRSVNLYATYSKGFKSGGFNIGGLQPPFQPEKLTNYEIGVKSDLFNRRLRLNVSAFNYDYKQLQVNIVEGLALVTRNAASARVRGIEVEAVAHPLDGLRLSLNAAYLDAKYRKFITTNPTYPGEPAADLRGNRLAQAPEYQINGEIAYTIETAAGNFTPRFNVTRVARVYFSEFNLPEISQPKRTEVDAYMNWDLPDSGWSATIFVKNISNGNYVSDMVISSAPVGYPVLGQYYPPRTFGASLTKSF